MRTKTSTVPFISSAGGKKTLANCSINGIKPKCSAAAFGTLLYRLSTFLKGNNRPNAGLDKARHIAAHDCIHGLQLLVEDIASLTCA